ncbi:hypothetical protein [Terriglobus sp. RCC_193]|uniref:hypothetical protein n=1 Tax=Terriglobus sp. RCC_193 TaxID=3239218 RepID=UPI003524C969
MSETVKVPKFENEADEARWWFENQDKVARAFDTAASEGTLRRTSLRDRFTPPPPASVVLDAEDAALANELAQRHGESFEGFVKRVMHQALLLEKSA